jgi:hypothetical protein
MKLSRATSGFALAAAITVLFNTVLACVKDSYKPLNTFMTSVSGHQWTTHGLADLILFAGLGLVFMKTGLAERIEAGRLVGVLVGSVILAGMGLAVWYLVV